MRLYPSMIKRLKTQKILTKLKIQPNQYYLVSCHREENVDDPSNLRNLVNSLNTLAKLKDFQ